MFGYTAVLVITEPTAALIDCLLNLVLAGESLITRPVFDAINLPGEECQRGFSAEEDALLDVFWDVVLLESFVDRLLCIRFNH